MSKQHNDSITTTSGKSVSSSAAKQGSKAKDPTAVKIGKRIQQARKMAGFKAARDINIELEKQGWSSSRLGNYESGISIPGPDEVRLLAELTDTSECWIYFGVGPIRSRARDIQAVRYQNLATVVKNMASDPAAFEHFLEKSRSTEESLNQRLMNPLKKIGDRLARSFERALGKPNGWFDEQHVDNDAVCSRFPDDLRELMAIYSEQDNKGRNLLLDMARTLKRNLE